MPRKHEQPANQPIILAAKLCDLIDSVPWPLTVFLTLKDDTRLIPHTFKPGDADCDRLRKDRRYYELGTYTKSVREDDLITDLAEAWGELR